MKEKKLLFIYYGAHRLMLPVSVLLSLYSVVTGLSLCVGVTERPVILYTLGTLENHFGLYRKNFAP